MFLKNLIIKNGITGKIIREINFHKGINFIVDETPSKDKKTTGNNVGKTTVLRLVDYCLGGKGVNIYQDTEFKNKKNTDIKKFLENNKVIIQLTLNKNFDKSNIENIVIERNFCTGKEKILKINSQEIKENDLSQHLKKIIFKNEDKKPTFRQIIAKNIRDDKNKITNIVKVLHNTTKHIEYEALYLFWLGMDISNAEEKQKLESDKTKEENFKKKLEEKGNLSFVDQQLRQIKEKIRKLEN